MKEKTNLLKIEKLDNNSWYRVYESLIIDEQNGLCQLTSKFLQYKAKCKIKELM